jgi:aspartate carbamoyltransferase regulatory subunit
MAGINFINEEEYSNPLTFKNNDVIHGVMCSACGEKIPEHEKNIEHLSRMTKSELEDVECISCEMKYRDSADIENF